jgi:uracil-DNA glycosylase
MYGEIFILGEAWGEHEERARAPFVGPSGYELTRMLDEASIARRDCYLSNVFNLRPKENNIENLCGTPSVNGYGPISKGKSIKADYAPELDRVLRELRSVKPNLVLALGNTAAWFLLNATGISKFRGTIQEASFSSQGTGVRQKVLPTFHPAAVLRQWELRPTVVADFIKARRESRFPEVRRPKREVWIAESLQDIALFYRTYLEGAKEIAFDIETAFNEITCIGFAPSEKIALCIPFVDYRKNGWSYWSAADEVQAWQWVKNILHLPAAKTAHNGIFDIHFLWRKLGATPTNYTTDTMLLHHALQPESRKGLGFLGSVYTNEASWKLMRQSDKILEKREK